MELIAFGFNAHGQLSPSTNPSEIPEDIRIPQIIASASDSLRVLFTGWSDTLLEIDGSLHILGAASANTQLTIPSTHLSPITSAFGDHTGLKGVTTITQAIHLLQHYGTKQVCFGQRVEGINDTSHIAIAGNGVVAAVQGDEVLVYRSFSAFLLKNARQRWALAGGGVMGLYANEGGFVVLTREYGGRVITWGDARHEHLGRETTAEAPAGAPGIVDALDGIAIARVGSGGWCSAAVSAERDLYVWGGAGGDVLAGRGEVELVQEFEEVDGVSVGDGHVVAWAGGKLWGIGQGENGQLGREGGRWRREWREIEGVCRHGKMIRDVVCGGWSTLVVCQRQGV
ncbi:hypothetical protein C7212DRAFT_302442 [Tuber magnatum]|uniref:RCC1/BLIP-II protein n=1 Tax=Tuber magnatum TaxID=42249 RepID=A0A317SCV3_9PEZI|nr:hypothetical protein C7212DRAFT_302442 [Tuber magnatum]